MQSRLLQDALASFVEEVSCVLQAELAAGAEMPFELAAASSASRRRGPQLYSPLTGRFLVERWPMLCRLQSCAQATKALEAFRGLDRYLASVEPMRALRPPMRAALASQALKAFAEDVFREQSDFALHEGRLQAALARVDASAAAEAGTVTLLASLHGMAILSPQVQLSEHLTISRPDALAGVPEQAVWSAAIGSDAAGAEMPEHLLVVLDVIEQDGRLDRALAVGREQLRALLRALWLYGDGRIALGGLAWACAGEGPFSPVALGCGGRSHGVLVVRPEQEDELRAFCSLLARRAPRDDAAGWALRRFELGCERVSELEALSDHVLALQALLEPERVAPGLLASRTAALCAMPEDRKQAAAGVLRALELERGAVGGEAVESAAAAEIARELAGHVRALLRDLACGHLPPDLIALADEITLAGEEVVPSVAAQAGPREPAVRASRARRKATAAAAGAPAAGAQLVR